MIATDLDDSLAVDLGRLDAIAGELLALNNRRDVLYEQRREILQRRVDRLDDDGIRKTVLANAARCSLANIDMVLGKTEKARRS